MKKSIIITSYMENSDNFNFEVSLQDYVICTDGGYDIALEHNISPNLLLGDFDSVTSPLPKDIETIRFNPEKDFTDLELALKQAVERNFEYVEIWGGIGGRLDHTIANIQLISSYCNNFTKLVIKDGSNSCFCIHAEHPQEIILPADKESYLSLFALSDNVTVSISGAKYPLHNHSLTRMFPLGVSNEFTDEKAIITVAKGTLLIIQSKKKL